MEVLSAGTDVLPLENYSPIEYHKYLEKTQVKAKRSCVITIINNTNLCLILESTRITDGAFWSLQPPQLIMPGATESFGSHSSSLYHGHNGLVKYFGEDEMLRKVEFYFQWHNQVWRHNASIITPEYYSFERNVVHGGRHEEFQFKIFTKNYIDYPLEDRLDMLQNITYFNRRELLKLWDRFYKRTHGTGQLNLDTWRTMFPYVDPGDPIIDHLFNTLSRFRIDDNLIDFEEYAQILSIMSRGTTEEKVKVTFAICDLNRDGVVERKETLEIARVLSTVLQRRGFDEATFGNPFELIDNVFHKSVGKTQINMPGAGADTFTQTVIIQKALSRAAFVAMSIEEPDLAECFGLFKFFDHLAIKPIEEELGADLLGAEMSGSLWKSGKRGTYTIRSGFMSYFRSKFDKHPARVVDLTAAGCSDNTDGTLIIKASSWDAKLKCMHPDKVPAWAHAVRQNTRDGFNYQSFAPKRHHTPAQWYVNGKEYYTALMGALKMAKKRVFIVGWYMSPGLYLKRDPVDKDSRLDKLLLECAQRGAQIYIIIWSCFKFAYDLQSKMVEEHLNALHPNIKVMSHPHSFDASVAWSHHQKAVVIDDQIAFVGGIDLGYSRYDDDRYLVVDPELQVYPGRDYSNFCLAGETNGEPDDNVIDRTKIPRMPWHDIAMAVDGWAALDVSINFIQKWNHISVNVSDYSTHQPLLPVRVPKHKLKMDFGYQDCTVQILRSAGPWSLGIPKTEKSIQKAYIDLIKRSRHCVYIENQYFISGIDPEARPRNKILRAMYERLRLAIIHNENYCVYVIIPVHASGKVEDSTTRYIIKYTYDSICRGPKSIIGKLRIEFPQADVNRLIGFYCLRNYGFLEDKPVTEQIYIHAKLMIVDDRYVVIGSANLNDRSMMGDRDAEICAIVEEPNLVDGKMGGRPFKVSPFARDLRMKLWRSYLGLSADDNIVADPVERSMNELWRQTAAHNTQIYLDVFQYLPDNIRSLKEFIAAKLTVPQNPKRLKQIRGFLTLFPTDFLESEDLAPSVIPSAIFL